MYVDSIHDIPLQELQKRGIKGIIIDLDNTITEWNNPGISNEAREWFRIFQDNDIKICLASNNNQQRVLKVAQTLGIPFIAKAGKPRRKSFRKAMEILGTNQNNTAVIGDQIFTDVLGGNRLGLFTILVVPLSTKEFLGTRVVRFFERKILKYVTTKG